MPSVIKKHTALQTILLHLLPGLVNIIAIILLMPLAVRLTGSPENGRMLGGELMVIVAMVPMQIGLLLYYAKKTTNTYNIFKLMPFQEKSKLIEYLLFIAIAIIWALSVDALLTPIEHGLRDGIFSFVPDAFAMRNTDLSLLSKIPLIFTACLMIITNGFVAPITEELYFRGYLLPRINLPPMLMAVTSAVLFSLYHFFSPWYFFSRILMMIPIYCWVVKRKNIRFAIIAHVIANVFTSVSVLLEVLRL